MITFLKHKYDDYWEKSFWPKVQIFDKYFLLKNDHKSQVKLIYSILTALAVAELNYVFLHLPLALIMTFILIIHELGHYIYAKASNAKPSYPLFIPIPFLAVGITHIIDMQIEYIPTIALAGIFTSLIYLLIMFIYNSLLLFINPFFILTSIIFSFVFNYFGSDGRKYKLAKQKI